MKKIILFIILATISTLGLKSQTDIPIYSFFAAGHTYGSPNNPHYGLHYPFVDYIPTINNYPNMDFGVLTGDVVFDTTAQYWDSAIVDISTINIPTYIAPGNHDIGPEFLDRFGSYYFSFKHFNDLFIVLTPGLDSWNISEAQLEFLTSTLENNYTNCDNIFIFMHELIWWSPDNEYKDIVINYAPHYPGSTNYETVIKPLLLSYPNNITIYAGDLGCTNQVTPFMYHSFDNITLIGSGMGGGVRDNIIITDVYEDSVHYNLVALNGNDPNSLGELTDYSILAVPDFSMNNEIQIYPNPCVNYFNVKNDLITDLTLGIYNNNGQLIQTEQILNKSINKITTTDLRSGTYYLLLYEDKIYSKQTIIVK